MKGEMATKASYEGVVKIRSNLEDLMGRMMALKREGKDTKSSLELRGLVTEASVLFIDLRRENREILQEEDRVKLETEAAKAPIDQTSLQLHNLLYEKNHYVKAIKTCKDFKSKYPDIDLVPEESFFLNAPQDLQSDPALRDDPHKLMLQRLNFELHQRKELLKQRESLEARKKLLQENIANRRKFLGSLTSHLKALKKATLPVQQQLGILHTRRSKQNSLAELLPSSLYILYTELQSYKEAFGEAIEVDIAGSGKEALTLARHLALKEAGRRLAVSDEGKIDEELPEDDDDTQRRRKRGKKSHDKEVVEGDNLYQAHPLAVTVQINDEKQRGIKLFTLRFEFLMKLNVLCVGEEGTPLVGLAPGSSLANLFPDDRGLELPNQTTKLQAGPGFKFDAKRPLRPYKWVQYLGGKDILPDSPLLLQDKDGHGTLATYRQQFRVQNVLQLLRARRKAQMALKDQLESLGKLRVPTVKSDPSLPWTLHNPKVTLRIWAQVSRASRKPLSSVLPVAIGNPTTAADTDGVGLLESEGGKEDGELPSAVVTSADSDTDMMNSSKPEIIVPAVSHSGGSGDEANTSELVPVSSQGTDQSNVSALGGSKGGKEVQVAVGQRQSNIDTQMDETMGGEAEQTGEDSSILSSKGNTLRHEFGTRTFRAVFRRENGPNGKRIELEAQIDISVEYPVCPPLFRVQTISGVAVVSVDSVSRAASADEKELRAMEFEVNSSLVQRLSARDRNQILTHQLLELMRLIEKV